MMKAIVHTKLRPLDVLRLPDVAPPVPNDDEALPRVRATP